MTHGTTTPGDGLPPDRSPLGVGIVGAGPVVQSIHVPTLARLGDEFEVVAVLDVDDAVAAEVADRAGATPARDLDALLGDERVDVVAICTPQRLHAEQTIAALRAGKRAVLCEKPLAQTRDEAEAIRAAAEETGVPLVVGAMHVFDPAWVAVLPHVERLRREAHTVRSSIVLPPNDRFEDWSTDLVSRPGGGGSSATGAELRAELLAGAILGLAIHDLPLVRAFLPDAEVEVSAAEFLAPFGYAMTVAAGGTVADVSGLIQPQWRPRWEFEAVSDDERLHVEFPPSFVHAGSAVAELTDASGTRRFGPFAANGYEEEWRALARAARGDASAVPPLGDVVADLAFAAELVDASGSLQRSGASA